METDLGKVKTDVSNIKDLIENVPSAISGATILVWSSSSFYNNPSPDTQNWCREWLLIDIAVSALLPVFVKG